MVDYYPPWGFYYRVEFGFSKNKDDVRFQTVSGLTVEYDMEEYKEGGENRFTHKLPVRTKYADLVLKRGMLTKSEVFDWLFRAFRDREFKPTDLNIVLLNEKGEPLRTWKVAHAVPRKWQVSDLNASENSLVIETLELSYRYFTVQ
uniref:Phage tail protein n=1 Tax=Geobacter sp. (strain M21) TaxID=443144 RepID=C6E5Y0_GEOSM